MLIDPWGEVKAVLPEGEGIVIGDIEPHHLIHVRESLPALGHRKL
jgi:nitrilase